MGRSQSPEWRALSAVEREAIILRSIIEITTDLVNNEMLAVHRGPDGAQIMFPTGAHRRVFGILLVDLLSPPDSEGPAASEPFLRQLKSVADAPLLVSGEAARGLQSATSRFRDWLCLAPPVAVWFPALDRQVTLELPRRDASKMAGSLAKHDALRAVRVARELRDALARSHVTVTLEDALLALDDFKVRFYDDILEYHASTLAEHINDIRWAIQDYLSPEFERSFRAGPTGSGKYGYDVPAGIENAYARDAYWSIMNSVRSRPYVPRFEAHSILKLRY